MDTAKERVEQELKELSEKITKLASFLYGNKFLEADLSCEMRYQMEEQFRLMCGYASCLQRRLKLWGKTSADLERECANAKIGCVM